MLTVNHLTLSVRRQPLLREVAFSVAPGEVLTLMGPSGSGKSTLFAWMIGALSGDFRARGELWLNERRCDTLPTEHRRIGILFQDPLLFDHFSVGQNLQLALPENVRGEARKTAVEEALSRAGLAGFAPRDPATLSGGQRARVSLLRALLARPEALLLDEPFGALDALTRAHLQDTVMHIQQELNTTIVMITHDVDEAVLLSDRVLMMTNGPAATVGEILAVDLPRPRHRVQLADDSRYHHLRQQILHFLYEKQPKAA